LNGVSIAQSLTNYHCSQYSLVVGGLANFNSGTISYGSSLVSSAANNKIKATYPNGCTTQIGDPVGTVFNIANPYLMSLSANLASKAATGFVSVQGNTLVFVGTKAQYEIFNVSASTLANAITLKFTNWANFGTLGAVIINVVGNPASLTASFDSTMQTYRTKILFNFVGATTLTLGNQIDASVLAIYADANTQGGNINGQLFLKSYTGYMELHYHPFVGCLNF